MCETCGKKGFSEFKHGTVIGCHLCNKSVYVISSLLDIPIDCKKYGQSDSLKNGFEAVYGRHHTGKSWEIQMFRKDTEVV